MTLEGRIANWIELGIRPYQEVIKIQNKLVLLRRANLIQDTILSVQHPVTVSFGASANDNQFSEKLLYLVNEKYGNSSNENVIRYLNDNNIPFSISDRGGGATVFAPGQFLFYPVVNHSNITGGHPLDVASYKSLVYKTIFDSLQNLGVQGINVGSQISYQTRNERKDAWIERDGVTLKMGSKGFKINNGIAYHGFALYVDEQSISPTWLVNQCGYSPREVKLWTVEQELGRKINPDEVYNSVKSAIKDNFGYNTLRNLRVREKVTNVN